MIKVVLASCYWTNIAPVFATLLQRCVSIGNKIYAYLSWLKWTSSRPYIAKASANIWAKLKVCYKQNKWVFKIEVKEKACFNEKNIKRNV